MPEAPVVVVAQYADLSGITKVAVVTSEVAAHALIDEWETFHAGWTFSIWTMAPRQVDAIVLDRSEDA